VDEKVRRKDLNTDPDADKTWFIQKTEAKDATKPEFQTTKQIKQKLRNKQT